MQPFSRPRSKLAVAVETLRGLMAEARHATFRGHVYRIADGSTQTYTSFCTPQRYVDAWLKNPAVADLLIDCEAKLKKLLSEAYNCVSEEVVFEYDLVEVILY